MEKLVIVDAQRDFVDIPPGLEEVLTTTKLICRPEEHVSAYLDACFGNLFPRHCLKV